MSFILLVPFTLNDVVNNMSINAYLVLACLKCDRMFKVRENVPSKRNQMFQVFCPHCYEMSAYSSPKFEHLVNEEKYIFEKTDQKIDQKTDQKTDLKESAYTCKCDQCRNTFTKFPNEMRRIAIENCTFFFCDHCKMVTSGTWFRPLKFNINSNTN